MKEKIKPPHKLYEGVTEQSSISAVVQKLDPPLLALVSMGISFAALSETLLAGTALGLTFAWGLLTRYLKWQKKSDD